jgi:hypothetical protein
VVSNIFTTENEMLSPKLVPSIALRGGGDPQNSSVSLLEAASMNGTEGDGTEIESVSLNRPLRPQPKGRPHRPTLKANKIVNSKALG